MDTVVLSSPDTLAQDPETMESVLLGLLLQVTPASQVTQSRSLKKPAFPFSPSLLGYWRKGGAKHISILEALMNRLRVKTLTGSLSGHHMPPPPPPYWINLWVKKNWMNLNIFSDSEYLFTTVFYISQTLFFGQVSKFLCAHCLDSLLLNI